MPSPYANGLGHLAHTSRESILTIQSRHFLWRLFVVHSFD